ncbi:MAG: hypothetical protein GY820_34465 [Gammaproteobacteria bacterium]|nr:hypothetical protein [Gammaproteobacteria bacterium]
MFPSADGGKSADYHADMDAEYFEQWTNDLISSIKSTIHGSTVVVMDNAPYHSRKIQRAPTSRSKKAEIQAFLRLNRVPFDQNGRPLRSPLRAVGRFPAQWDFSSSQRHRAYCTGVP